MWLLAPCRHMLLVTMTLTNLVKDIVLYIPHLLACYLCSIYSHLPVTGLFFVMGLVILAPMWIGSWFGRRVQV